MRTSDFEEKVRRGQLILLRNYHDAGVFDGNEYIFMGYTPCSDSVDADCRACPGYVKLENLKTGKSVMGCYRNGKHIRLEFKKEILPAELFEI